MPSVFASTTSFSRKAALITSIALLLASLAGVFFGMQSTSVGAEGLHNHGILGIGFACLGASVFLFGIALASDAWSRRPRGKKAILEYLTTFLAETGKLGVTILIYGGGAIIAPFPRPSSKSSLPPTKTRASIRLPSQSTTARRSRRSSIQGESAT